MLRTSAFFSLFTELRLNKRERRLIYIIYSYFNLASTIYLGSKPAASSHEEWRCRQRE